MCEFALLLVFFLMLYSRSATRSRAQLTLGMMLISRGGRLKSTLDSTTTYVISSVYLSRMRLMFEVETAMFVDERLPSHETDS